MSSRDRLKALREAAAAVVNETEALEAEIAFERLCACIETSAQLGTTISYKPLSRGVGIFSAHLSPMLERRMEEDPRKRVRLAVIAPKHGGFGSIPRSKQGFCPRFSLATTWMQD